MLPLSSRRRRDIWEVERRVMYVRQPLSDRSLRVTSGVTPRVCCV